MLDKKIHVCVIDGEVCGDEISISKSIQIKHGETAISPHADNNNSHGTVCAKVIEKCAKKEIRISSISILDEHGKGNVNSLCKALGWCVKNKVDIINLSLGSVFFKDRDMLWKTVNHCGEQGIIIVGAVSNAGYTTYPACFTNVLGVKAFEEKGREGYAIRYDTNLGFGLLETKGKDKIRIGSKEYTTNWCNSIAAPHVTAEIINRYEKDLNPIKIRKMFEHKALEINCFAIDWVCKAYARNIQELIPKWCVFDVLKEEKHQQHADTVITQSAEDAAVWLRNGKNVIYLGNGVLHDTSDVNYVWSEYNRLQQIKLNKTVITGRQEVPVIFIKGKYALNYIYGLSRFFTERDYHAYGISHHILYELYGITYVPIPTEDIGRNEISNFINNELYYKLGDLLLYDISKVDEALAEETVKMSSDILIDTDEMVITILSEQQTKRNLDSVEAVGEYLVNLLAKP